MCLVTGELAAFGVTIYLTSGLLQLRSSMSRFRCKNIVIETHI